jgi:hypothetical protein
MNQNIHSGQIPFSDNTSAKWQLTLLLPSHSLSCGYSCWQISFCKNNEDENNILAVDFRDRRLHLRATSYRRYIWDGFGQRSKQSLGIWMFWILEQICVGGRFYQASGVHDQSSVTHMTHHRKIVGYKKITTRSILLRCWKLNGAIRMLNL